MKMIFCIRGHELASSGDTPTGGIMIFNNLKEVNT